MSFFSNASTLFERLLQQWESPTPTYSGRGETGLALAVIPLAFAYKLLDCLHGKNAIPGHPWAYILLLSLFTAFAFSSVFWLASPPGEVWIRRMLRQQPLLLSLIPALYVGGWLLLLWLVGLPELHSHALRPLSEVAAGLSSPASGLILCLLLFLATVILAAAFFYALRLARNAPGFGLRELGCVLLAVLPYLLLQAYLPLLWTFTTPVAVVVMIYATGLGRELFNFSFVPRSLQEAGTVLLLMAIGLTLFLLITLGAGTISYTGGLWRSSAVTVFNSVFTWLLIVGVSEEIIFRCGVLTLLIGWIARRCAAERWQAHPRATAVLLTSLLFALAHLFRGATMIFLSFLAGMLYGLAYIAGKSLFGPVLLHGLLNVLILMNFHLADFQ